MKSILESLFATTVTWLLGLAVACATPSPGAEVITTDGTPVGVVEAPVELDAPLPPCVVIVQADGHRMMVAESLLCEHHNALALAPCPSDSGPAANSDLAFEIRSMAMAAVMQEGRDMAFVADISDMVFVVHEETLRIDGTLTSPYQARRLLALATEFSGMPVLPRIDFRES